MTLINEIQETYKDYTHLCAQLTKEISEFLVKNGFPACISIEDEVNVEILFKTHLEDVNEMMSNCEDFNQFIDKVCEKFSLRVIRSESGEYQAMELPVEYRTFLYEKVLLEGVENE